MSELKTLKDLIDKGYLSPIELKAEAVKWVKKLRIKAKFEGIRLRSSERDFMRDVFKHFFNLTEEDLE